MQEELTLVGGETRSRILTGPKYVAKCPEWPLITCLGPGKDAWAKMMNAVAEVFEDEETKALHVHVYEPEYVNRIMADVLSRYPNITTYSVGEAD